MCVTSGPCGGRGKPRASRLDHVGEGKPRASCLDPVGEGKSRASCLDSAGEPRAVTSLVVSPSPTPWARSRVHAT